MTNVELEHTLRTAKTVAVVGCSERADRPSNAAARMLLDAGFNVIPVNPKYQQVHGLRCYSDIYEVPDEIQVDIMNVFRRSEATAHLIDQIVDRSARTGRKPVVWTQFGVSSPEAVHLAIAAELPYVHERCIMIELGKLDPNLTSD